MIKLLTFAAVICSTRAGIITTGLGIGHGGVLAAAPVAVAAPIAVRTALATSYQNNNQISLHPTAVVAQAPIAVAHAPVAIGAPIAVGTLGVGSIGLGGLGLGGGLGIGLKGI